MSNIVRIKTPAIPASSTNASLSPEMAIRLDKAFGVDTESLMRMQNNYDIARAKQRQGDIDVVPYR